jgi:hypothetical protein
LSHEVVGERLEPARARIVDRREPAAQLDDVRAARLEVGGRDGLGAEQRLGQLVPQVARERAHQLARMLVPPVEREAHPQAELGVVLEERIAPRRSAPGPRRRSRAWSAGCRRRSTSSRSRSAISSRSPKSWVKSFT